MAEVITENIKREVHTFKQNGNGPEIRLGGAHGKLWGALKEARGVLFNAMGDQRFKSPRILEAIQVRPVWVTLVPMAETRVDVLPQIMNSMSRGLVPQHFDVIPQAVCDVTLIFPANLAGHVDTLIDMLRNSGGMLNKRRATVHSIEVLEPAP